MGIKIKIRKERDITILEISGKISSEDAIQISKKLEGFVSKKPVAVVVDLSGIAYLDSHWLGVFVYSWKMLHEVGTNLVFLIPEGFILELFRNANLDRTFNIIDSIEKLPGLLAPAAPHC